MWYPLNSSPPHTYLSLSVKEVHPRILRRILDKVRTKPTNPKHLEPPFLEVECSPCDFSPDVDVTRRRIAFGRWDLPKLRRELHDESLLVVKQALNSFADLLHDPEKVYFALDLYLVARLEDLLVHEDCFVRLRSVAILTTLSTHRAGVQAVAERTAMPELLAELLRDRVDTVRLEAALALEIMSRAVEGIRMMTANNYSQKLLNRLIGEDDNIVAIHLITLRKLLSDSLCASKCALRCGAIHVLVFVARSVCAEIVANALMALAALMEMPATVLSATRIDLMPRLAEFMEHENLAVQTAATAVLMGMTAGVPPRRQALRLPLLPTIFDLLENYNAPDMQLYCLKALANICEVPAAREMVKEYYLSRIEGAIFQETTHLNNLEKHREILITIIHWMP